MLIEVLSVARGQVPKVAVKKNFFFFWKFNMNWVLNHWRYLFNSNYSYYVVQKAEMWRDWTGTSSEKCKKTCQCEGLNQGTVNWPSRFCMFFYLSCHFTEKLFFHTNELKWFSVEIFENALFEGQCLKFCWKHFKLNFHHIVAEIYEDITRKSEDIMLLTLQ